MDNIFGFVGKDYVLLAADCTAARSIIAYKHDEDKIKKLDSHKLVAAAGPQADTSRFTEYVQRNMALHEFRTGLKLSVPEACSYIRNELATALRKAPYQVNMLVGGMDDDGPHLVFMDYLASAAPVNYGAQGYAGYFVSSLMDRHWKAGMSLEDGVALARICAKEIRTRLVVSTPRFIVKIVDATGIRELPFEPAPAVPGMPEAGAADAGAVGEGGVAPAVAGAGAGAGAGAAVAAGGRGMDE